MTELNSYEWIDDLTEESIVEDEVFEILYSLKDVYERSKLNVKLELKAKELKMFRTFQQLKKAYEISQIKPTIIGNKTDFIGQSITLNCGEWICDNTGVRKSEFSKNENGYIYKYASPIPILPAEILTNIDSGNEKIKIEYFKEGWKSFVTERSRIANNNKIIDLADKGLEVNSDNAKLLVKYIADCVSLNLDILPRNKSIDRLGWVDNTFVPYDMSIKFDGEQDYKSLYESICQKGDYTKWINFTSKLRKNIFVRLQMAASFASVLIEKINALPFVLHLWGGTGNGKTVGMMVAMSIWGNPQMGAMTRTMNMTSNSMMSTAAFLKNLPFAGDELQTIKDRWGNYDNLIMKVTEGIDRGRMSYSSINPMRTWKCAFLFTGEEPCTKISSGGGAVNRVIEIECNDEKIIENGNEVCTFINENYGFAGVEFVNAVNSEKNLIGQYKSIFDEIINNCDTTEKQAMAMSIILLGDKLATQYIFKNEKPLTVNDVKHFMYSKDEVDVSERAYEFVVDLIAQNINKFRCPDNDIVLSGEIWGQNYGNYVMFNKHVISSEMSKAGFEFDAVKKKWREKEYIFVGKDGKYTINNPNSSLRGRYIKFIMPKFSE